LQFLEQDNGPDLDCEGVGSNIDPNSHSPEHQPTPDLEIIEQARAKNSKVILNLIEANMN
jgi:hypothetical protein